MKRSNSSHVYELDLHVLAALTGESEATVIKGLWEKSLLLDSSQRSASENINAVGIITSSLGRTELAEIGGLCVLTHNLRCLEAGGVSRAIIVVNNASDGALLARRVKSEMMQRSISLDFVLTPEKKNAALTACQALSDEEKVGFLLVSSDHMFEPNLINDLLTNKNNMYDTVAILVDRLPKDHKKYLKSQYLQVQTHQTKDSKLLALRLGIPGQLNNADSLFAGIVRIKGNSLRLALEKGGQSLALALDKLAQASKLQAISTRGFKWLALDREEQNSQFFNEVLHSPSLSSKKKIMAPACLTAAPVVETPPKPYGNFVAFSDSRDLDDARANVVFSEISAQQDHTTVNDIEAPTWLEDVHSRTSLGDAAVLVGLEHGACFAVAPTDTVLAAWDDISRDESNALLPPVCVRGSSKLLEALLRATGVDDVSDVSRLALTHDEQQHVELVVERRVPLLGWIVLVLATFAQASSGLVGELVEQGDDSKGRRIRIIRHQLALIFWRPFAATLLAIPLGILRRLRKAYRNRLRAKRLLPEKKKIRINYLLSKEKLFILLTIALVGFWASNALYQIAFLFASNASDVVLLSNATPLVIVIMKAAGCGNGSGPLLSTELIGTVLGSFGALLCAKFSPPDALKHPVDPNEPRWMHASQCVAIVATILCVVAKAGANVAAKDGIRQFSPLDLHVMTQVAGALISFILILFFAIGNHASYITGEYGAFGLFAPTANRLPAYIYSALVVDTLGTLGYLLALKFVDPLLVAVAALFQPACALLETALIAGGTFPGPFYALGLCLLVFGGALIAKAEAHSAQFLTADDALTLRPDDEDVKDPASLSQTYSKKKPSAYTRLLTDDEQHHQAFLYAPV